MVPSLGLLALIVCHHTCRAVTGPGFEAVSGKGSSLADCHIVTAIPKTIIKRYAAAPDRRLLANNQPVNTASASISISDGCGVIHLACSIVQSAMARERKTSVTLTHSCHSAGRNLKTGNDRRSLPVIPAVLVVYFDFCCLLYKVVRRLKYISGRVR